MHDLSNQQVVYLVFILGAAVLIPYFLRNRSKEDKQQNTDSRIAVLALVFLIGLSFDGLMRASHRTPPVARNLQASLTPPP